MYGTATELAAGQPAGGNVRLVGDAWLTDGRNEIITGNAHGYGLWWSEQTVVKGKRTWTHHAIDREEVAADEYVAIRLQRDRVNNIVRSCARIETAVQVAIGVEPRNPVPVRAVDAGERTSDQHFAIRL